MESLGHVVAMPSIFIEPRCIDIKHFNIFNVIEIIWVYQVLWHQDLTLAKKLRVDQVVQMISLLGDLWYHFPLTKKLMSIDLTRLFYRLEPAVFSAGFKFVSLVTG